jgi:hypothetical protein
MYDISHVRNSSTQIHQRTFMDRSPWFGSQAAGEYLTTNANCKALFFECPQYGTTREGERCGSVAQNPAILPNDR